LSIEAQPPSPVMKRANTGSAAPDAVIVLSGKPAASPDGGGELCAGKDEAATSTAAPTKHRAADAICRSGRDMAELYERARAMYRRTRSMTRRRLAGSFDT
jgi:hypothetical protein